MFSHSLFSKELTIDELFDLTKKLSRDKILDLIRKQNGSTIHDLRAAIFSKKRITPDTDKYVLPISKEFKELKLLVKRVLLDFAENSINGKDNENTAEDYGITSECLNKIRIAAIQFMPEYMEYLNEENKLKKVDELLSNVQTERTVKAQDIWAEKISQYHQ
ncbi:MAG: hypothetical protein H0W64_01320 [Gammaproteobacteria bacterium]|nr:hypothetical protein [Gammaproteobacteria bacterium]